MANSLTNVVPQILAQGLVALRENAIMPRLVNTGYSPSPGEKGSSVDVPIPSAITANAVTSADTPQADTDVTPTKATITLNQWYEAGFTLDDQEITQAMDGTVPMQVTEAVKALANNVDDYLLALYTTVYGFGGSGGTTPFASDLSAVINARRELERNLAPSDPRFCVIDPDAEANALGLRAFQDSSYAGTSEAQVNGYIGRKLGAQWHLDQNVPQHTAGTMQNGASAKVALVTTALAAGASTMAVDHTTLTGTLVTGDVFSFSGHSGTYVVTGGPHSASSNEITGVTFSPDLREAVDDNETVTVQDTHRVNSSVPPGRHRPGDASARGW